MHKTRLPLTLWFWAASLVATHGPGISALQLQRQLGISRYETAWTILHKLRRSLVAPEREPLTGEVEVDESYLGGRDTDLRGGRQRDGKPLVGVAVEVRGGGSGRLRLQLLPDPSAASLTPFVASSTHHGVSPKHLHVYLVFRHNRRRTPLAGFHTLLGLGATHEPTTYHQITRRQPQNRPAEQSG